MRLLLIENDHSVVDVVSQRLQSQGNEVLCAFTRDQAKRLWEEQLPDLVIVDPLLQNGDALTMCRDMQRKHDTLLIVWRLD